MAIVLIAVRKRAPPGMIKICPNSLAMFGNACFLLRLFYEHLTKTLDSVQKACYNERVVYSSVRYLGNVAAESRTLIIEYVLAG